MRTLALTGVLLLAASCSRQQEESGPIHYYRMQGEVVQVNQQDHLAQIKHDAIVDDKGDVWMTAMTMEFPVQDPVELSKLRPGQKIRARLCQQLKTLEYWVDQIQVVSPAEPKSP